jgi:hypothetical protein
MGKEKEMSGKEERAQGQQRAERGGGAGEGPQLMQKIGFGLGAALLAGAVVVTAPSGVSGASRGGYLVTSVALTSPINGVQGPYLTTCCPPRNSSYINK